MNPFPATRQVSTASGHQAEVSVELELACLCNLAFAYIKQGLLTLAEKACCQALEREPSCVKALYRRGQARLNLGRPDEAAKDFHEIALLEPSNGSVTTMLRRAEEATRGKLTAEPSPPHTCGVADDNYHAESELEVTHSNMVVERERLEGKICASQHNPQAEGRREHHDPISDAAASIHLDKVESQARGVETGLPDGEQAVTKEINRKSVFHSDGMSSFMVSGWLTSSERKQAVPLPEYDKLTSVAQGRETDIGVADHRDSREIDGSISTLVSKIKLRKDVSAVTFESTAATKTDSEWLRLRAEERENMKVLGRQATFESLQAAKCQSDEITGSKSDNRCGKIRRRGQCNRGKPTKATIGGPTAGNNSLQAREWALLEDEELHVRNAFRAKLGRECKRSR